MVEDKESIDQIRKLSAKDRVEKLRELEEKNKKEIEEVERLIQDSEKEAEKERIIQEIDVPEQKKVDIKRLFSSDLEETVEKEKPKLSEQEVAQHRQYQHRLSRQPIQNLYERAQVLTERIQEKGYANPDEQVALKDIDYAVQEKLNATGERYQSAAREIKDLIEVSGALKPIYRK